MNQNGFVPCSSLGDHEFVNKFHHGNRIYADSILTPSSHLVLSHLPHILTLYQVQLYNKHMFYQYVLLLALNARRTYCGLDSIVLYCKVCIVTLIVVATSKF